MIALQVPCSDQLNTDRFHCTLNVLIVGWVLKCILKGLWAAIRGGASIHKFGNI